MSNPDKSGQNWGVTVLGLTVLVATGFIAKEGCDSPNLSGPGLIETPLSEPQEDTRRHFFGRGFLIAPEEETVGTSDQATEHPVSFKDEKGRRKNPAQALRDCVRKGDPNRYCPLGFEGMKCYRLDEAVPPITVNITPERDSSLWMLSIGEWSASYDMPIGDEQLRNVAKIGNQDLKNATQIMQMLCEDVDLFLDSPPSDSTLCGVAYQGIDCQTYIGEIMQTATAKISGFNQIEGMRETLWDAGFDSTSQENEPFILQVVSSDEEEGAGSWATIRPVFEEAEEMSNLRLWANGFNQYANLPKAITPEEMVALLDAIKLLEEDLDEEGLDDWGEDDF